LATWAALPLEPSAPDRHIARKASKERQHGRRQVSRLARHHDHGVRKGGEVVVAGDGQVSLGQTVIKGTARKVRRLSPAGATWWRASPAPPPMPSPCSNGWKEAGGAPGQLARACVELAKDWRTDKYLQQARSDADRHRRAPSFTSSPARATCSNPNMTSPPSARAATMRSPPRAG
jgi:hypothetical protein